jgi:hypothetical protein
MRRCSRQTPCADTGRRQAQHGLSRRRSAESAGRGRCPGFGKAGNRIDPGLCFDGSPRYRWHRLRSISCLRRRCIHRMARPIASAVAAATHGWAGSAMHAGGPRAVCARGGLHPDGDGESRRHRRTARPAGRRAAASRSAARGMTADTDCARQVRASCRAGLRHGRSDSEQRGLGRKSRMSRISRLACAAWMLSTQVPMRWLRPVRRVYAGDRSVVRWHPMYPHGRRRALCEPRRASCCYRAGGSWSAASAESIASGVWRAITSACRKPWRACTSLSFPSSSSATLQRSFKVHNTL